MSGIPSEDPWVRFMWAYPGPIGTSTDATFAGVVRAGYAPEGLVAQAQAYRRLCDAQDMVPAPADTWLAAITEPWIDDDGPTEVEAFSAAVRALRAVHGWSQKELAAKAGIGVPTLIRIENESEVHEIRRATRLAVADALGWSVDELVDLGCMVLAR